MDSPGGSSVSSLGASEATKLLKEMLNMGGLGNPGLGKSRSESSDTSTASLASHVRAALENSDSLQGVDKADNDRESRHENGNTSFEEMSLPGAEPVSDKQTVRLQGTDTNNSFVITGRHVEIIESEASGSSQATSGSNKVKINPVVKFEWEHRYYTGNMVAVHTDCVHVAYVLKGKSGGIVRIINRKTAQRTLLKGFTGRVQDIAFARLSTLILGCVDEAGDMFIHEIQESPDSNISTTLLLNVTRPKRVASVHQSPTHLVSIHRGCRRLIGSEHYKHNGQFEHVRLQQNARAHTRQYGGDLEY
ncbi:Enhancer of mRNA-decapping protein 4 [Lamellibrachia satsuma]|nr:Enhancer of mRNA-decapping protein 4 [Lamellibrachia satsuma]